MSMSWYNFNIAWVSSLRNRLILTSYCMRFRCLPSIPFLRLLCDASIFWLELGNSMPSQRQPKPLRIYPSLLFPTVQGDECRTGEGETGKRIEEIAIGSWQDKWNSEVARWDVKSIRPQLRKNRSRTSRHVWTGEDPLLRRAVLTISQHSSPSRKARPEVGALAKIYLGPALLLNPLGQTNLSKDSRGPQKKDRWNRGRRACFPRQRKNQRTRLLI